MEYENIRYLYIMLSHTSSGMARIIRAVTHEYYNHASVSLDESLETTYSCARYRKNVPLAGGFIEEIPERFMYDHGFVPIKLYKLSVSTVRYKYVKDQLEYAKAHPGSIIYNSFDAVSCVLGKRTPINDAYTCVGYVSHLLGTGDICFIGQLEELLSGYLIYEGYYGDYIKRQMKNSAGGIFFKNASLKEGFTETVSHFKELSARKKPHRGKADASVGDQTK